MPAQSIIVDPPAKTRFNHDPKRYEREQAKQFARTMPVMRLTLGLKVNAKNVLVADSWNIKLRHPAAMRHFRKELARFLREIDGTVVIEDPKQSAA